MTSSSSSLEKIEFKTDPNKIGIYLDKIPAKHKKVILFFFIIFQISKSFCNETPQVLQYYFEKNLLISTMKFNFIYSSQSYLFFFPFLVILFIKKKFTFNSSLFIFSSLLTLGNFIFLLGAFMLENLTLMIIGRFLFNLFSLSIDLIELNILSILFDNKEINKILALNIFFSKIGNSMSNFLLPRFLYSKFCNLNLDFLILFLISIAGYFSLVLMTFFNRKNSKREKMMKEKIFSDFKLLQPFRVLFILIFVVGILNYTVLFGFLNNANIIFDNLFNLSVEQSGKLMGIFYIIISFVVPLFLIKFQSCKYYTEKLIFSNISFIALNLVLISFNMNFTHLIFLLIIFALFYSQFIYNFSIIIFLLSNKNLKLNTLMVMYTVINISYILSSFIVGIQSNFRNDVKNGYIIPLIIFIFLLFISLLISIKIYFMNKKHGKPINNKEKQNIESLSSYILLNTDEKLFTSPYFKIKPF